MKSKHKIKKILLIALGIIFIAGVVFGIWYFLKPKLGTNSGLEVSESTKKEAEQSDVERVKSSENKNSNQGSASSENQQSANSQSGSVSVNISSIGQSGDLVYVNGLVSGATNGTCKLSMTKNNQKIEKSAPIGFQVSYYICQGFSISTTELVEKGEWTAVIEITSPSGSAKSEPRQVSVQ